VNCVCQRRSGLWRRASRIPLPLPVASLTADQIGSTRFLFTTEAGKALLVRAARMKPGTPAMNSFWKTQVAPNLGKLSASATTGTIATGAGQQQASQ